MVQPTKGATRCSECGAGKFAPEKNETTCQLCPKGYYSDSLGSSKCAPCFEGTFAPANASTYVCDCPAPLGRRNQRRASFSVMIAKPDSRPFPMARALRLLPAGAFLRERIGAVRTVLLESLGGKKHPLNAWSARADLTRSRMAPESALSSNPSHEPLHQNSSHPSTSVAKYPLCQLDAAVSGEEHSDEDESRKFEFRAAKRVGCQVPVYKFHGRPIPSRDILYGLTYYFQISSAF